MEYYSTGLLQYYSTVILQYWSTAVPEYYRLPCVLKEESNQSENICNVYYYLLMYLFSTVIQDMPTNYYTNCFIKDLFLLNHQSNITIDHLIKKHIKM